ncbi:Uncharacterised protein [Mycobacterium tuberculosis]|uniref:Uncharacterized protein n=1 Tax=Mycobacterium tuberculosis TaxID=1773 RepID=A0A655IKJ5_MYCTX|nr:Uncharacterised protein [Mycobacterium tuberculosis]CKO23549.1 Uncharacterised protein [Mycobacterium tuberculosis]CKR57005.1 Uncharacterised protein [Mycobacterium tuberculosis]CKR71190.1 Uncharacterised protein [Mycobacterium tuberculosis]CKT10395.1 Uncharacterised protein [Mycobacterium tuberculosis]
MLTIGPPRSILAGWGVSVAVTVRPLCGRAASAASIAAVIPAAPDAVGFEAQAASAKPLAMPAPRKPRRLNRLLSKALPLVASSGIDRSSSGFGLALRTLPRHRAVRNG